MMTKYHKSAIGLILGLTIVRLLALIASPLGLHGDEAQYWSWSRNLDWGYFSKPPMIAWLIGATTSVFGNAEWAVRLSSVIIHPLTAYVIFRTARFLFDERAGLYALGFYFVMPAVWLSSGIVSTDVGLLLCWAVAINALFHLRETPTLKWAAILGVAIGVGLLSKYAMLFFLPALFLSIIIDRSVRSALISGKGLVTAGFAALCIAPNIIWNAGNSFATVSHTASNTNISGVPFHPLKMLEFVVSQFAVFGVITFGLVLWGLVSALKAPKDRKLVLLALFVLSPLLIITGQGLLSRANANWAVTAYVAAPLLLAGLVTSPSAIEAKTSAVLGIGLNAAIGSILIAAVLLPSFANFIGAANGLKRMRGWPDTASAIAQTATAGHEGQAYQSIAMDSRLHFFDLEYYGLEEQSGLPMKMWMKSSHANHHAEAVTPLAGSSANDRPILVVNHYKDCADNIGGDFTRFVPVKTVSVPLGGGKVRNLDLFAGYGYTPTGSPDRTCQTEVQ